VIGTIFLAAMLASLSRSDAAWGSERTTRIEEHALPIREQIVGTWRLESIYEEDTTGEEINQFGVAPTGLFMADRHGNFSFQIMSIDGRRYAAKGLSSTSMGIRRHCRSHALFRHLRRERAEPQAHAACGALPVSKLR
jgi:hypothetical protein